MSTDDSDKKKRDEDKRLNSLVAITVVILTVFGAVTKVKDDNINQAMQKAKPTLSTPGPSISLPA